MPLKRVPDTAVYYSSERGPDMQWYSYQWECEGAIGMSRVACFDYNDFMVVLDYWGQTRPLTYKPA